VATTPADLSIARCCDRLAFEMPSPCCNSEAQRSPRASISINCSRVGLANALQITACRSKISCSPLDFRFVPTDSPESNEYLTSQATTGTPRAASQANLEPGHRNHWLVLSASRLRRANTHPVLRFMRYRPRRTLALDGIHALAAWLAARNINSPMLFRMRRIYITSHSAARLTP